MVYGLGGVVNLAHGEMAVMAAIIAARLMDRGAPTAVAVAVGIAAAGVLGVVIDRTLMQPVYRENFVTDNGNIILDIHNMEIMEPVKLEEELNNIPGIVTVGLFAKRPADVLLLGTEEGVKKLT